MYCHNVSQHWFHKYTPAVRSLSQGLSDKDEPNISWPSIPIWNMTRDEWFMHGPCRNYPPPDGEFLDMYVAAIRTPALTR